LKAMETMQASFGLSVGYSDHTEGIAVPIAAVAMGAKIIEKHFTLDKSLRGPDHAASIEPAELTAMVKATRAVEKAKGSSMKLPTISELCNRDIARRSIVAAQPIKAGEKFTASNLSTKRPGSGLSPMQYWQIIGTTSDRDYQPDDAIES